MRLTQKERNRALNHVNGALQASARDDVIRLAKHAGIVEEWATRDPEFRSYAFFLGALQLRDANAAARRTDLMQQALKESREVGNIRFAAHILLNLSYEAPDPRAGIDYAQLSLHGFKEIGDERGISNACLNIGVLHSRLGNYDQSRKYLDRSRALKQQLNDTLGIGIASLNIASSYIIQGEYSHGLVWASDTVDCLEGLQRREPGECVKHVFQTGRKWIAVEAKLELLLGHAYNNLGNVLDYLGHFNEALANYLKARSIMHELGNMNGEAMVLNQIGDVFREKGEYAEAEVIFNESRLLFEQTRTQGQMYGVVLQSIGEVSAAQHKAAEALHWYEDARLQYAGCGNMLGEAEATLLIGELHILNSNYEQAITHLDKGLEIAQRISAAEIVVRGNRALGTAWMHKDSSRAREYLTRALGLAEEYNMTLERHSVHLELSSYYKLIGDSTTALSHYEKFHQLERQIHTENGKRQLQHFAILHNVEQYKQSLAEMERKVKQIEAELEARTHELASLAVRIMEKQEFVRLVEKGLLRIIKAHADRKNVLAQDLIDSLRKTGNLASDWDELIRRFLSVHSEFAKRLMELGPSITPAEFQVCVLSRLSMEAKQIANFLDVTPKTVFNQQGSVRKKLGIKGQTLKAYLIRLESSND